MGSSICISRLRLRLGLVRRPDFFIVGQGKSGTTALYEMLRQHPQIYMSAQKEPSFFSSDLRRSMPGRPLPTLEEYLSLFTEAGPEQQAGEASTDYIWSPGAAQRIREFQPAAKIIVFLREPASFVASLHLELLKQRFESEPDLRKALALESVRRNGHKIPKAAPRPTALLYSDRARYVEQLRRYYDVFPSDQILVLIYEDFRADNEKTLGEILAFLGVDDELRLAPVRANPTLRVRSPKLHSTLHSLQMGETRASRVAKEATKMILPSGLRRQALTSVRRKLFDTTPQVPDEEVLRELRERFRPEVVATSEYLGRDLVQFWGYDRP